MQGPMTELMIDILPAPPDVTADALAADEDDDAADEGEPTRRLGGDLRDRRRPYTYTELQAECAKQRQRADDFRDAMVEMLTHGISISAPRAVDGVTYYRLTFRLDEHRTHAAVAADPLAIAHCIEQARRAAAGQCYDGRVA